MSFPRTIKTLGAPFFLALTLIVQGLSGGVAMGSTPLQEAVECQKALAPVVSMTQKIELLKIQINNLQPRDREFVLRLMSTDSTAIEGKDMLLSLLMDSLGYRTERDRLRVLHRKVQSEISDRLAGIPLVRKIMRGFGSTQALYQTPAFLSDEIARLYGHLTTDEQRNVALASLDTKNFPVWGLEALQDAFIKLGMPPLKAEQFVTRKVFTYKELAFFYRDEDNRARLVGYRRPEYFQDYQQVPAVEKFTTYFQKRIVETVAEMQPHSTQDLLRPTTVTAEEDALLLGTIATSEPTAEEEQGHVLLNGGRSEDNQDQSDAQATARATPVPPATAPVSNEQALESLKDLLRTTETLHKDFSELLSSEQAPATKIDPALLARAQEASTNFNDFFRSVAEHNLERDIAIKTIQLILLIRGNAMIIGPTGTAKTALVEQILGRILDDDTKQPSFASQGFNHETTADEILGPMSMRQALDNDTFVRQLDSGITQKRYVLLDEIDKARAKLYAVLYGILNERVLRLGQKSEDIPVEVAIGTANKYISQLYTESDLLPQEVQPFLDRFDAILFVPGELEYVESVEKMAHTGASTATLNRSDLQALWALLPSVKVPSDVRLAANWLFHRLKRDARSREVNAEAVYQRQLMRRDAAVPPNRSTRIFSPRNLAKVLRLYLPAIALQRWINNPAEPLQVRMEDIEGLKAFLTMTGVSRSSVKYFRENSRDPIEASQYELITDESEAFDERYYDLTRSMNQRMPKFESMLKDLESPLQNAQNNPAAFQVAFADYISRMKGILKSWQNLPARNADLDSEKVAQVARRQEATELCLRSIQSAQEMARRVLATHAP